MSINTEITGEVKVYEVADLHLKCHACDNDITIFENVVGGKRLDLFTTDKHVLVMACDKCDNKLELYYTEAANPPEAEPEAKEDESVEDNVPEEGNIEEPTSELIETKTKEEEVTNEPIQEDSKGKE